MKELLIYTCDVCGYILEVIDLGQRTLVESGTGYTKTLTVADAQLICCGQPMKLLKANVEDASNEKHLPVIEVDGDKVIVKVGSIAHPMTAEHYIKWITILHGDKVQNAKLEPTDTPEAVFYVGKATHIKAYAYCNLHGLWMSEKDI